MATRLHVDDAAITRALKSDSEALRYAEWWVRRRIYGLSDDETRWLAEQYLTARKEIINHISDAMGADGINPLQRERLLQQVEQEIRALYQTIEPGLVSGFEDAFRQGAVGRVWVLQQATISDFRVRAPYLPSEAIRALVLSPYLGVQFGENLTWSRDQFVTDIKRSLTQSMIQGEGMRVAAKRLDKALGITPGQRSGFGGDFWRTMLIARTEIMRASNLGALTTYEANQDILNGWEWVATRDERTCSICGALDGKVFKFGDPMLAPPSGSHIGCRCTVIPVLIDEALQTEIAGVRETYPEWAARNGVGDDGGLSSQRTAGTIKVQKPPLEALSAPAGIDPRFWGQLSIQQQHDYVGLDSTAQKWLSGLSEQELGQLQWYRATYESGQMNGYLRDDPKVLDWLAQNNPDKAAYLAERADKLDAVLQKNTINQSVTMLRGANLTEMSGLPPSEWDKLIGTQFTDAGFTSGTLSNTVAYGYAGSGRRPESGVIVEIAVPAGTSGGLIQSVPLPEGAGMKHEFEVLLPRNTTYEVISMGTFTYQWQTLGGEWITEEIPKLNVRVVNK
jgi:SPP1 gp7 family putative phage head morphogenesis protein